MSPTINPWHRSPAETSTALHQLEKRHPPPPLPGNDTWYAAPDNLTSVPPGGILKWRPAPRPLSLDNVVAIPVKEMYQIQYRTQNAAGTPIANVLTAIIPESPNFNHLFSYIYFSDTPCPNYNPSLEMTLRPCYPMLFTKEQIGPLVEALDQGWIVAVPDDNGPEASFPSGPTMAYTTLDSMRAMLQSEHITGLSSNAIITLNGYSGGGISAAWTGELHPVYAPELDIAGIALGGLVPNFTYLSEFIREGTGYFAWGPITLVGLSHDYPQLSSWLDENLIPEKAADFWLAETLSIQGIADKYTTIPTCSYFTRGCDAWSDEIPSSILYNSTTMGIHSTPKAPWYLYETAADEVSPINLTRALYEKYCAQGATIYYEESQLGLAHATESVVNFPGAFEWMKERHAGVPVSPGCKKVDVSIPTLMSGWPISILEPVIDTLIAEFDGALSPKWTVI
ncbi:uncharacterized protein PV09_08126 [Verruconis gallopava]|uniref:Secretory lipase-domain-containing protein n=1 Tax=Verruconis gallopava TaxID=253628 RepID=A0A0D2A0P3_9PEZI|nr:uncharacterized protein PV09_08126 [Verruconis gallopava]KIW00233.1 hypothetical protein PV09_08126 [Verruconis gallopava]